jgi:hypothetical protein
MARSLRARGCGMETVHRLRRRRGGAGPERPVYQALEPGGVDRIVVSQQRVPMGLGDQQGAARRPSARAD